MPCRRFADAVLCLLFVAGVSLPALCCVLRGGPPDLSAEQRRPAPPPAWRLSVNFPSAFDAWYTDAFGGRAALLAGRRWLMADCLGQSPTPTVLVGRDGWLYYAWDESLSEMKDRRPLTAAQLERRRLALERRRDWLAARGIAYVFVVAPNKQSVYPEHLPRSVDAAYRPRLDDLLAYLEAHSDVRVLDLRPVLRDARRREPVFRSLESHWTDAGAFAAYQAIIGETAARVPGCPPAWPRTAFREERVHGSGDLARTVGMEDEWAEDLTALRPLWPRHARPTADGVERLRALRPKAEVFVTANGAALPRAVVFHDSFTLALMPFLGEHFGRVAYVLERPWPFSREVVAAERPDVVLEIRCERYLSLEQDEEPEPAATAALR